MRTAGYRLWMRGRADRDAWSNDSAYVQFSGAVSATGAPVYEIGTTSATWVGIEDCSGCGLQGWGWQDNGYGTGVLGPLVYFAQPGTHTLRVQQREDGLSIDQIVLSPVSHLAVAPGTTKSDQTLTERNRVGDGAHRPRQDPGAAVEPAPRRRNRQPVRSQSDRECHGVHATRYRHAERSRESGWGNEDQPERYRSLLEAKTGRRWYSLFAQEYGNWSANGKGNEILSTFPIRS